MLKSFIIREFEATLKAVLPPLYNAFPAILPRTDSALAILSPTPAVAIPTAAVTADDAKDLPIS